MKTLLLITSCEANLERIKAQSSIINSKVHLYKEKNIKPVLVLGENNIDQQDFPCVWNLPLQERYTNLYQKIILSFEEALKTDFDYLIKIDDDTLFNIEQFNPADFIEHEYIGRFQQFFTKNEISINLPMYNLHTNINLYPSEFKTNFKFATGDCYILKRNIVEYIISKKDYIWSSFNEKEYVCEDQLIGFLLSSLPNLKCKDINYEEEGIQQKSWIQVTKNLMSLHPVNLFLFSKLASKNPKEQLEILSKDSLNLCYRTSLLSTLKANIVQEVLNFANSKKIMGMG